MLKSRDELYYTRIGERNLVSSFKFIFQMIYKNFLIGLKLGFLNGDYTT